MINYLFKYGRKLLVVGGVLALLLWLWSADHHERRITAILDQQGYITAAQLSPLAEWQQLCVVPLGGAFYYGFSHDDETIRTYFRDAIGDEALFDKAGENSHVWLVAELSEGAVKRWQLGDYSAGGLWQSLEEEKQLQHWCTSNPQAQIKRQNESLITTFERRFGMTQQAGKFGFVMVPQP